MKVLLAWPPKKPSFFNECYHFAYLGELAGYLRNQEINVTVLDGSIPKFNASVFEDELKNEYDVLAIFNFPENIVSVRELIELSRKICPRTKIITYGFTSSFIPEFFKRYALDAICYSGDWGLDIENFTKYCCGELTKKELSGIHICDLGVWSKTKLNEAVHANDFGFPAIDLLPLDEYKKIWLEQSEHHNELSSGKLSLTISKGCQNNCAFCQMPRTDGTIERRRDVKNTLDFIEQSVSRYNFKTITMYAPIFTFDKEWVERFCREKIHRKLTTKWKCTTTVFHITEELIKLMRLAGCYRIGFGVETLELEAQKHIKKIIPETQLAKVIRWCNESGIRATCFIMLGIPGQTKQGILETITKIKKMGGIPRATIYTPFQDLKSSMSEEEIVNFNKNRDIHNIEAQLWV
jgi:anaerobic magnesium-protoporphyrin IX monomethyl ester cyclase